MKEKTGEGDAGEYCAQTRTGRRACGDTTHVHGEGVSFRHGKDDT